MYNDDILREPANEGDFWSLIEEHFEHAAYALWNVPVETRDDAIAKRYRTNVGKGGAMESIRYRNTSPAYDNREYFLELGRSLTSAVECAIKARQRDARFVQLWGQFMFCHGYVAAYFFEDSDDMFAERAGAATYRDSQRKWVAHILEKLTAGGMSRFEAEAKIIEHVKQILDLFRVHPEVAATRYAGFGSNWFKAILPRKSRQEDALNLMYQQRKFNGKRMRKYLDLDLPIPDVALDYP